MYKKGKSARKDRFARAVDVHSRAGRDLSETRFHVLRPRLGYNREGGERKRDVRNTDRRARTFVFRLECRAEQRVT